MSTMPADMDFDDFKDAVLQLSDDQREELLFEMFPDFGEALVEMENEAIREEEQGQTKRFDEIE